MYVDQQAKQSQTTSKSATPLPTRIRPVDEYIEQDWQKIDSRAFDADTDWSAIQGENPEEWECVACDKMFRSEAAWINHEKSRKHKKAVDSLKRGMQEENDALELGEEEELAEDMTKLSISEEALHDKIPSAMHEAEQVNQDHQIAHQESRMEKNAFDTEHEHAVESNAGDQSELEHPSDSRTDGKVEQMSKREKRRARQANKTSQQQQVRGPHSVVNQLINT
jgi:DnaJ homolog subfamily A member 5